MAVKGGYQIVDMKGTPFTSVTIGGDEITITIESDDDVTVTVV